MSAENGTRITPEVEEFLRAARGRDSAKCADLLANNESLINSVEAGGFGALHFAAFNGDVPMTEMLLQKKPNVNLKNLDDNTPLMLAAKAKQHEVVRMLAEAGADVNLSSASGVTAAHHAAAMGNPETLALLKQLGANIGNTKPLETGSVLHWAAHSGEIKVVGAVIHEYGVPVDTVDANGGTPLFTAIYMKKPELVTFLLEQGANPNFVVAADGTSLLHLAAEAGTIEEVKALLAFGANPEAKNKAGETAVDLAKKKDDKAAIKEMSRARPNAEKKKADAARFKAHGNKVFVEGENVKAAKFYSLAITLEPENHVYFSNRAACYFNSKNLVGALYDANRCIQLKSDWPKGYFRKAATLHAMKLDDECLKYVEAGLKFDRMNKDLLTLKEELMKKK